MIINFDELVVARFALARYDREMNGGGDLGFCNSMLLQNIMEGKELNPLWKGIPEDFVPDWADLKAKYDAAETDAFRHEASQAYDKIGDNYKELVDLWNEEDYVGMVSLMENC